MTALWIVGILLLIFLAVQLCRVGVRVTFGEETRVTARFGPVRVQLLPRKEKKPPKKEKPKKKETKKPAKEPWKPSFSAVWGSLPELWRILKKGLRMTFRRIRISPMDFSAVIGGEIRRIRPFYTASSTQPCGRCCRRCRSLWICRTHTSTWSRICRAGRPESPEMWGSRFSYGI